MAVPVIQGALRRSALTNIGLGISSGIAGGYTFWYGWHVAQVKRRDEWYMQQAERKKAESA